MHTWDDTIAALASAAGSSLRGIVRLSGPDTPALLSAWLDAESLPHRSPRRMSAELRLPNARAAVAAEIQFWPTHRSYTGQPVAEIHTIGSSPVLQAILGELYRRGARPARPGEFTLRAFLSGKLDLLQAEAVLGVIDAADHRELETALQQLAGGISHRLAELRSDLLELLADLEAGLDFVEEHLEFVGRDEVLQRITTAAEFVEQLCEQAGRRMHAGERLRVVLAGLPNAGKSTLFNRLLGDDRALVSPVAGTTRDYLSGDWNCGGLTVELVDTAGWDDVAAPLNDAMRQLMRDQLSRADLIVWCSAPDLTESEQRLNQQWLDETTSLTTPILRIGTKADMPPTTGLSNLDLSVSAETRRGLEALAEAVRQQLDRTASPRRLWLGSTAARCEQSLHDARRDLRQAEEIAQDSLAGDELIAGELRLALHHLGEIVGTVYTDDLLDRIFSKFCIGK